MRGTAVRKTPGITVAKVGLGRGAQRDRGMDRQTERHAGGTGIADRLTLRNPERYTVVRCLRPVVAIADRPYRVPPSVESKKIAS